MTIPDVRPSITFQRILECYPGPHSEAVLAQFDHRLAICAAWGIEESSQRLLDVGCGQGECSLVLASVLGPKGHITGTDVAPPDYGGPYTLDQCQKFITKSALGSRISFKRSTVEAVLDAPNLSVNDEKRNGHIDGQSPFHAAILCHSLWYFDSADDIKRMFALLAAKGIPRIYMAEWKGEATTVHQEPHCLAMHAQSFFHAQKPRNRTLSVFEPNIRAAFSTADILNMAAAEGWHTLKSGTIPTSKDMLDGYWEAQYVSSKAFRTAVAAEQLSPPAIEIIDRYIEMVELSAAVVKRSAAGRAASMDVSWAILEPRQMMGGK